MLSLIGSHLRCALRSPALWVGGILGLFLTVLGATLDILGFDDPAERCLETGIGSAMLVAVLYVLATDTSQGRRRAWSEQDSTLQAASPGAGGLWLAARAAPVIPAAGLALLCLCMTSVFYKQMPLSRPMGSLMGPLAFGFLQIGWVTLLVSLWKGCLAPVFGDLGARAGALALWVAGHMAWPPSLQSLLPFPVTLSGPAPSELLASGLCAVGLVLLGARTTTANA